MWVPSFVAHVGPVILVVALVGLPTGCDQDLANVPDGEPCVDARVCTLQDGSRGYCLKSLCEPVVCDSCDPLILDGACACPAGQQCVDGDRCEVGDPLDCRDRECGPAGTGWGTCGTCEDGVECHDGHCGVYTPPCCAGKVCGDDCLGGTCGTCAYGDCSPDGTACLCTPSCVERICGGDGCGGSCGDCDQGFCTANGTACAPLEVGVATRLTSFWIPATPGETGGDAHTEEHPELLGAACLDVSGDGVPDNGLGSLLSVLVGFGVDTNGELAKALADDTEAFLLELDDSPTAGTVTLNGYLGVPAGPAHHWLVEPRSVPDGHPMLTLLGADLDDTSLELGPAGLALDGLIATLIAEPGIAPISATLARTRLVATLVGTVDADGAAFHRGTLAGAIFKADLDRALFRARKWCAEDPEAPADACGYIQMADMSLVETFMAWDLDLTGCEKTLQLYDPNDPMSVVGQEPSCQAVSLCAFWASEKARIVGVAPAATE